MEIFDLLVSYRRELAIAVVALALVVLTRRIVGRFRRRQPVEINPKLAKYAGRSEADIAADRLAAQNIIATGSTGSLAGYEIVRQIDAVFVEGHRSPQEAMDALRAAAGRLGANAIINLTRERTTTGRCTAGGDAVLVHPKIPPASPPPSEPIKAPVPKGD